ncbi:hypothetical protein [Oligella sp. HMSC05A10]|uniref:hypothetical protein n=1 Tax=Oligella sp. HMSC05A10 TaxID=1581112 RepID=UPI00114D1370|nr:hypothetical protein [Oligella sp. HMSC05A10]
MATLVFFRMLFGEDSKKNYQFIFNSLFYFLIAQLIICLGQLVAYTFDVSLPVSELYAYDGMVTGTFTNANDLAAIVVLMLFIIIGFEKYYFKENKYLFWTISFVLLIIASSRSAIFFTIILFILNKTNNFKKFFINIFLLCLVVIAFVLLLGFVESDAFTRISARLSSFLDILQHGLYSDSSVAIRLGSYLHFLEKIPELGLGSGEINNYFKYSDGAGFESVELLFQNPHSIIVEIGYWLGGFGLLFFLVPIFLLLSYSRRMFSLVTVLLLTSMMPSSVLGNHLYFLLVILSFLDFKSRVKYINN